MDAATSPAVTNPPLRVAYDDRPVLVEADLIVADISDRTLRLALLLGWHQDIGSDIRGARATPYAELAQSLRCSIDDVRVAWDELTALRGLTDGVLMPHRHACSDGDW